MAIAGGVNVTIHPDKYRFLSAQHFAATDGRCRAFGEGGDGYVPGEAVASVLLKPLSAAQRDGDHVYALIRGTAINHGGKTNGYTVTNPNAQAEVIGRALTRSGVSARDITYIEAHGTGTQLGDPIEIRGLVKAFAADTDETGFCRIGSVKSNIGHAEGAAGVVSLIKTVEQLRRHTIVPSLHSQVLNPQIDFDRTPFRVAQELQPWRPSGTAHDGVRDSLIAGVSSFGAGGSNAHIIVEEYRPDPAPASAEEPEQDQLIPFAARNAEGMARLLAVWEDYLSEPDTTAAGDSTVTGDLLATVADLLQLDSADAVDASLSLDELGIDSFLADGLTERLLAATGIRITWAEIAHLESLADVAAYIDQRREPAAAPARLAAGLPACRDIAFTMQRGRIGHRGARAALVVRNHDELLAGVRMLREGQTSPRVFSSAQPSADARRSSQDVATLLASGDLPALADAYAHGARLDWEDLIADGSAHRVSLPLYPCERQPLWLDPLPDEPIGAAAGASAARPAPLVDENVSTLTRTLFRTRLEPGFGAISDHVIQGVPLLPGAQYLEICNQVGRLAGEDEIGRIRNVIWRAPISVTEPRDLYSELTCHGDKVTIKIASDATGGGETACQAEFSRRERRTEPTERVDLAALGSELGLTLDQRSIYQRFGEAQMNYGPLMQPLVEVSGSPTQLLARLRLPSGWPTSSALQLHPSLLDGAFQAVAVSSMLPTAPQQPRRATVPFGLDSLTINAPIPEECFVWVMPASRRTFAEALDQKLAKYRVKIINPAGEVVVDIEGFSGMVIPGDEPSHSQVGSRTATTHARPAEQGSVLDLLTALEQGAVSQELVMKALSEQDA